MCYMTVLSTSSRADLALHNNELVKFSRDLPGIPEEIYLRNENKWFIGSASGCSCDFRHLHVSSVELGFGLPEDWYAEEPSHIDATRQVAVTIRALVSQGEQVDCVDAWAHGQTAPDPLAGELEVDLAAITNEEFRFFEGYRFVFVSRI